MTKQHTKFPLPLVYSFAHRPQVIAHECNPYLTDIVQRVLFKFIPVSGVNFSHNISVSQVRVNIKESENGTTFEIS